MVQRLRPLAMAGDGKDSGAATPQAKAEEIPIDIFYDQAIDWLIDRKWIQADFREKSDAIRKLINAAIKDMPDVPEINALLAVRRCRVWAAVAFVGNARGSVLARVRGAGVCRPRSVAAALLAHRRAAVHEGGVPRRGRGEGAPLRDAAGVCMPPAQLAAACRVDGGVGGTARVHARVARVPALLAGCR